MSDNFNPPTIISLDIPDVVADTLTSISADEARIAASRQKNNDTLDKLTTLKAQIQALIDLATAVTVSLDADDAKLATLKNDPALVTAQQPVVPTPPPDETVPSEAPATETTG